MSVVKPEPGMTYDFEVEGVFSFDDSITFLGVPSVNYRQLSPVKAQVIVDGSVFANVNITADRMTGTSNKSSIVTYDKLDIEHINQKKVTLHCVFQKWILRLMPDKLSHIPPNDDEIVPIDIEDIGVKNTEIQ